MNKKEARMQLPLFATADYTEEKRDTERLRAELRLEMQDRVHKMKKRYGLSLIILFVWAASMMVGCCLTGWIVQKRTENRVRAEEAAHYEQMLADYHEQKQQEQAAQYFLTGEASKEAAINQETDAVAAVISKLSTDQQKLTEAACILARVMNASYPNSFAEVCAQPGQWMFYDGTDKTFSQHDRELADSIVRPYMESGIIPNGLSDKMIYGAWSTNDFVLRDSFENAAGMTTWRFAG